MNLRRRGALIVGALLLAGCGASPPVVSPPPPVVQENPPPPVEKEPEPAAGMAKSDPVSVDIPKIGARSSLVSLGLNADNTVEVPPVTKPLQAGWYSYGPTPGEVGPSVILGHVDGNKQKGIFFRLKEMAPGDKIAVARKDGSTANFVVTKVDRVPKDTFPTDAVYGNTLDPELRLITCGGSFDRQARSYRDNIIVFATLA
ncbi:class F sortase [Amycolatopsis sp.]|uniref:class F sortase n=1 Tax=Amycolatopsis sp. TaxID=37632 RepID=UPI002DFE0756|nr:class F sortase [Amycolatopsis sp.]